MSLRFPREEYTSITLRVAMSTLGAVYDPLGLCTPYLLSLKLYIQECWKLKAS